jgi:hypothetical protein
MALALAGSTGFERAVAWCVEPRSFGSHETAERPGTPPSAPSDLPGPVLNALALLPPLLLLPGAPLGAPDPPDPQDTQDTQDTPTGTRRHPDQQPV